MVRLTMRAKIVSLEPEKRYLAIVINRAFDRAVRALVRVVGETPRHWSQDCAGRPVKIAADPARMG